MKKQYNVNLSTNSQDTCLEGFSSLKAAMESLRSYIDDGLHLGDACKWSITTNELDWMGLPKVVKTGSGRGGSRRLCTWQA